ncbi:hypothetical protein NLX71_12710 [Paenibacillus sp. MZ04-78.2]|uniref:hypothetical protein n=1 Tax=Paenibacillus sp. MZ04-78.2 TaxID=2962034 RepID=UPI0020B6E88F|nr:hypothetical protein [Paenibacillus sp. MZ04-78.2]MCP3774164.1 hypothetical protein [Paenibacillus sp. MZ04-78.2]
MEAVFMNGVLGKNVKFSGELFCNRIRTPFFRYTIHENSFRLLFACLAKKAVDLAS